MSLRIESEDIRKRYHNNHSRCPSCHNTKFSSTYMGFILDMSKPEEYRDENKIVCSCGWTGITHDLVP